MPEYRYLVVGGGMTGDSACRGIRNHDPDGSIGLVGWEERPPYVRPPLTKGLWTGKKSEDSIWRGTEKLGVDLHLGRRIASLDLDGRTATGEDGETYGYERLLLATGGMPRRLPSSPDSVLYYRTYDHYRRLRDIAGDGVRIAVVGGGFIGSELAASLTMNGCSVSIFAGSGIGGNVFPADLASFVSDYFRSKGVEVLEGERVSAIEEAENGFRVEAESGRAVEADAVVAGLGIEPSTELAEEAGFAVDDGILVDEYGRVDGREDVFAAGDVARFPAHGLGGTRRVEHEDQANTHGRHVGANMAGAGEPYTHLPFFYSDLFDLGYEAVGDVDSRLETIAEWEKPHRKGVVCYVEDGKPRGFLLWDVWDKVDAARELIVKGEPADAETLRGLMS